MSQNGLAVLSDAERALAEATDPLDFVAVRAQAGEQERLARLAAKREQARPLLLKSWEIQRRCERSLGTWLAENVRQGERADLSHDGTSGLPDWCPNRNASSRWQQLARVDDEVFAGYLASLQRTDEDPTWKRLLRIAREDKNGDEAPVAFADPTIDPRHGDLRTALDDLEGTVDAIVTDPPYPAKFIEEWDALGEVAARVLSPNGVLVAMAGQSHLPAYLDRLGRHLTYRWCGAYLTEGPATRVHGRKVGTKWKPLLIFGGAEFITQDVFQSRGDDKKHHHWGQSESGMADIVERLTAPGQLVVDPFLGGGTTAVVCRDLGRRFVGCDVDEKAVAATKRRLAA